MHVELRRWYSAVDDLSRGWVPPGSTSSSSPRAGRGHDRTQVVRHIGDSREAHPLSTVLPAGYFPTSEPGPKTPRRNSCPITSCKCLGLGAPVETSPCGSWCAARPTVATGCGPARDVARDRGWFVLWRARGALCAQYVAGDAACCRVCVCGSGLFILASSLCSAARAGLLQDVVDSVFQGRGPKSRHGLAAPSWSRKAGQTCRRRSVVGVSVRCDGARRDEGATSRMIGAHGG